MSDVDRTTVNAVTAKLAGELWVGARVEYRTFRGVIVKITGQRMPLYWIRWDSHYSTSGPYKAQELKLL